MAVNAERDPARLVAHRDVDDLFRRHHGVVEDVQTTVRGISQPEFLFIRRERDAVARTAVAFHRPLLESLNLDALEHLASFHITDLKAEQPIHIRVTKRLRAVDGEWTDGFAERSDFADDFARLGVHHPQRWR